MEKPISDSDQRITENPYRSTPVDASHLGAAAHDVSPRWPSRLTTAMVAIALTGTISATIFIALSAAFGNAFEFFQNGGILHYASASLVHVLILNAIGAFALCFGIQALFPIPMRRPGWSVAIAVHVFAYAVANFIDDQAIVASRQFLYLAPATFLVPIAIWILAFILAVTCVKWGASQDGRMR